MASPSPWQSLLGGSAPLAQASTADGLPESIRTQLRKQARIQAEMAVRMQAEETARAIEPAGSLPVGAPSASDPLESEPIHRQAEIWPRQRSSVATVTVETSPMIVAGFVGHDRGRVIVTDWDGGRRRELPRRRPTRRRPECT